MDDCNVGLFLRFFRQDVRSDSSMDDCNTQDVAEKQMDNLVQIPLWTIVTTRSPSPAAQLNAFRFLYGRL